MKRVVKSGLILGAIIGVIALLGLGSKAVSEINKGAATITIDVVKKTQAPVVFEHKKHQERVGDKCITCHHAEKEGEQPKACRECHNKEGAKVALKDAFHKTCKDCHKKENAAGKKAPEKCNECHKK